MKIYFTASLYQREQLEGEYKQIIKSVGELGHELLLSFDVLRDEAKNVLSQSAQEAGKFYREWKKVVGSADVAIVEVSWPSSVNVGLEIGALVERGKPIICLYKQGRDPVFVNEFHSPRLIKFEYTPENITEVLKYAFEDVEGLLNRRFTFFISPEIEKFLNDSMQKRGLSRSEYIRKLIEKEIRQC